MSNDFVIILYKGICTDSILGFNISGLSKISSNDNEWVSYTIILQVCLWA